MLLNRQSSTVNWRRAWPALVVAAAVAFQFRAVLAGRVYWFEDIAAYAQPLYAATARTMRAGFFPSWDLGAWSGQPLVGDPQIGMFYPPNWLWLIASPVRVYAWLALFHAGLAAWGMFALARARRCSRAAAATAALALGLGAFMVLQVRHAMFVATTAWLPWFLWSVERYLDRRRLEHVAAIAATLALSLLGGGISMFYYGAPLAAVYVAGRLAQLPPPARRRALLGIVGGAALAAGLAAVVLLPAWAHARESPRALGLTYEAASSYAWPSWRYLPTLALPTLYGSVARGTYIGASDQWELCGYGVGAVATLLALLALLRRQGRGARLALLACCLVAIDVARGAGGLLHPLLYRALPLYASMRCPARALYVWSLAAPLLAADGLDALGARLGSRPRRAALVSAGVLLAVAVELLVTWRAELPSTSVHEAEARPIASRFLTGTGRGGRMATDVHLGQRFHNSGLLWGVESAVGYSSLPIWRYLHLLWIANHGAVYPHARLADDLSAQGLWKFTSPLVNLLNVKWLVTDRFHPPGARGFVRVFTGADGIDIWQNREVLPRAFVVYRAEVASGGADAAARLARPSFRPDRVAVVEAPVAGVPEPQPDEALPRADPVISLARDSSLDLALEVQARAPGVLVMSEVYYPGWEVKVDGKPDTVVRVDYALRGVRLSPGHHVVELAFFNRPLWRGAAISSIALLALLVVLALDRRRRGGAEPSDVASAITDRSRYVDRQTTGQLGAED